MPRNQTLFLPERPPGVTHSTRISTPPFRPPRLEPERKGRFQVFFGGKFCHQFYFVMKMENLITTPQAKWLLLNGTSAPRCHPTLAKKALSLMTRSPRLVHVCEPDQLGVECAYPQLAFGVRLVQLPQPNPPVAPEPERAP